MGLPHFLYISGALDVRGADDYHATPNDLQSQCNSHRNPDSILDRRFLKTLKFI